MLQNVRLSKVYLIVYGEMSVATKQFVAAEPLQKCDNGLQSGRREVAVAYRQRVPRLRSVAESEGDMIAKNNHLALRYKR